LEPSSIYAASDKLKLNVKWVRVSSDTEWIYFGAGNDVNEDFAIQKVTNYFRNLPVIVAIDRKKSTIVQPNELQDFLKGILGLENFYIWDQSFKRVIEFSHIGVLREGHI
jgi:hypothetical protein